MTNSAGQLTMENSVDQLARGLQGFSEYLSLSKLLKLTRLEMEEKRLEAICLDVLRDGWSDACANRLRLGVGEAELQVLVDTMAGRYLTVANWSEECYRLLTTISWLARCSIGGLDEKSDFQVWQSREGVIRPVRWRDIAKGPFAQRLQGYWSSRALEGTGLPDEAIIPLCAYLKTGEPKELLCTQSYRGWKERRFSNPRSKLLLLDWLHRYLGDSSGVQALVRDLAERVSGCIEEGEFEKAVQIRKELSRVLPVEALKEKLQVDEEDLKVMLETVRTGAARCLKKGKEIPSYETLAKLAEGLYLFSEADYQEWREELTSQVGKEAGASDESGTSWPSCDCSESSSDEDSSEW